MARYARRKSESGIFHVILRGINKQPIFEMTKTEKEQLIFSLNIQARKMKIGAWIIWKKARGMK